MSEQELPDADNHTAPLSGPNLVRKCQKCGLVLPLGVNVCPQDGTEVGSEVAAGQTFDSKYQILSLLGSGGMSKVWKARQLLLDKIVAIKIMHPHLVNEKSLLRFQQEGKAVSRLEHPNIVHVQDFGVANQEQPFMVMDFIAGEPLSSVIAATGALPVPRALALFHQVALALAHAHDKNVLHRDLKPANIMLVTEQGREAVKIVDFGIAKMMTEQDQRLTETGVTLGSPIYMSPEQANGQNLDERSDIYSMGCSLFESLTGKPPILGANALETLMKQTNQVAPSLEAVSGRPFPPELETFMAKLLAKHKEERPSSMHEVVSQLGNLRKLPMSGKAMQRTQLPVSNHAVTLIATYLAFLALLVCGYMLFTDGGNLVIANAILSIGDACKLTSTPASRTAVKDMVLYQQSMGHNLTAKRLYMEIIDSQGRDNSTLSRRALGIIYARKAMVEANAGELKESSKDYDRARLELTDVYNFHVKQRQFKGASEICNLMIAMYQDCQRRTKDDVWEPLANWQMRLSRAALDDHQDKVSEAAANSALQAYQKHADVLRLAQAYLLLGECASRQGNHQLARDRMESAHQLLLKQSVVPDWLSALTLSSLGEQYRYLGDSQRALTMATKSLQHWKQTRAGETAELAWEENQIGLDLQSLQQYDKALPHLNDAWRIYQKLGSTVVSADDRAALLNDLARNCISLHDIQKGKYWLEKAFDSEKGQKVQDNKIEIETQRLASQLSQH